MINGVHRLQESQATGMAAGNAQPAYVPKIHVSAASTSGRKKSGAVLMITFPRTGMRRLCVRDHTPLL